MGVWAQCWRTIRSMDHSYHRWTTRVKCANRRLGLCSLNTRCWSLTLSQTTAYRVAQKIWHHFFLYALTLPNNNRFSKLFDCQNQGKICNNADAKDLTTPQVCRYTTLWNVSVTKATIENKTTSVTTHFKKLTTGNNVFIVSVIV